MDTDLQIILEFLARCDAEVAGRAVAEPEEETLNLLSRFASGVCNRKERAAACKFICAHPEWLGWVADRMKARRIDPPPRAYGDGGIHWNS